MKHYFLGAAANYKHIWHHVFAMGSKKDEEALKGFLEKKYSGTAVLTKNGRSALALALTAYLEPGDKVLVNGFTCYAVVEAIKAAKMTPVYVDISAEDLNFDTKTLEAAISGEKGVKAIIVQNTLGNPVDIAEIEKFAKKHQLVIIEDLAHCAGVKYADGREAGTVGVATALSFGKEKSIDTISGGAVVFRQNPDAIQARIKFPTKRARTSDVLRARFYPMFGAMYRGLSYVKLNGVLMRALLGMHFVEKSADNKLDLTRKIGKFEAKLALEQLKSLKKAGEPPIRQFYLLDNRDAVLTKLRAKGYFFDGFWYEKPVSPARYYKKVHFPETTCPVATAVAARIINFPTYYSTTELKAAHDIVKQNGIIWEGPHE